MRKDTEALPRTLRSALVSDVLDGLGFRNQCLGWDICNMTGSEPMIGRAFTVTVTHIENGALPVVPYRGLLAALDAIKSGEIFVIPTDRSDRAAVWGELVSQACRSRHGVGALTDGLVRDLAPVRSLGFPVFARGTIPYDTNGRLEIVGHGQPGTIDGVEIRPGQLIVADVDGVTVVPEELEQLVLSEVARKDAAEGQFSRLISEGALPSEAFARTGVL